MKWILALALLSPCAQAFIPPLTSIVKDVFGERKNAGGTEAHLKHRITWQPGQAVEIEERIVRDSSGVHFLWKAPSLQAAPVAATYEKQAYWVSKERNFPTRSVVFWKYLVSPSADDVRDALVNERFIRRDQLAQYKNGFNPTGDPSTWGIKENYLKHEDIFLAKLNESVSIAVRGYQEGATTRTVFFEEKMRGMTRLEWKDGETVGSWNFSSFGKSIWGANLPKRAQMDLGASTVVVTEIIQVRQLNDRAAFDAKSAWKSAASKPVSLTPELESALKVLVSYR